MKNLKGAVHPKIENLIIYSPISYYFFSVEETNILLFLDLEYMFMRHMDYILFDCNFVIFCFIIFRIVSFSVFLEFDRVVIVN